MELHQLFKVQQIIENQIRQLSGLDENHLNTANKSELRFLALQVKVGELANLTKCYKYARVKEDISKDKIMILYVDALKFLLSIGNTYQFNIIDKEAFSSIPKEKDIVKLFSLIFEDIVSLKNSVFHDNYVYSIQLYIKLFARFVNLGNSLGLEFDEVYHFYMRHYSSNV